MSRSSAVFMCFEIGASALAVCDRLIDELLQRFRLLLLRDGAHDGVTHDVAVAIDHIGGGESEDVLHELSGLTTGAEEKKRLAQYKTLST